MGFERRHRESGKSDEVGCSGHFDRPKAECLLRHLLPDVCSQKIALIARQLRREVLHHARVGI
jgi:hypothetical protein